MNVNPKQKIKYFHLPFLERLATSTVSHLVINLSA